MKIKRVTIKFNGQKHIVYKYRAPGETNIKYTDNLQDVMRDIFKKRYYLYRALGIQNDVILALDLSPDDEFTPNCPGWKKFKQLFGFESDEEVFEKILKGEKITVLKEEEVFELCDGHTKPEDALN